MLKVLKTEIFYKICRSLMFQLKTWRKSLKIPNKEFHAILKRRNSYSKLIQNRAHSDVSQNKICLCPTMSKNV